MPDPIEALCLPFAINGEATSKSDFLDRSAGGRSWKLPPLSTLPRGTLEEVLLSGSFLRVDCKGSFGISGTSVSSTPLISSNRR